MANCMEVNSMFVRIYHNYKARLYWSFSLMAAINVRKFLAVFHVKYKESQ